MYCRSSNPFSRGLGAGRRSSTDAGDVLPECMRTRNRRPRQRRTTCAHGTPSEAVPVLSTATVCVLLTGIGGGREEEANVWLGCVQLSLSQSIVCVSDCHSLVHSHAHSLVHSLGAAGVVHRPVRCARFHRKRVYRQTVLVYPISILHNLRFLRHVQDREVF